MTAVNAGLTAASAANNAMAQEAAHRARVDRCTVFESRFDVARASVGDKQEYASCVETLYPTPTSEAGTYIIKGCILALLFALIAGMIVGWKEHDGVGTILMTGIAGVLFTALGLAGVGLVIAGIGYLFT